jgi:hypothetical protein
MQSLYSGDSLYLRIRRPTIIKGQHILLHVHFVQQIILFAHANDFVHRNLFLRFFLFHLAPLSKKRPAPWYWRRASERCRRPSRLRIKKIMTRLSASRGGPGIRTLARGVCRFLAPCVGIKVAPPKSPATNHRARLLPLRIRFPPSHAR